MEAGDIGSAGMGAMSRLEMEGKIFTAIIKGEVVMSVQKILQKTNGGVLDAFAFSLCSSNAASGRTF